MPAPLTALGQQQPLGGIYHQLGMVAQEQGRWEEAHPLVRRLSWWQETGDVVVGRPHLAPAPAGTPGDGGRRLLSARRRERPSPLRQELATSAIDNAEEPPDDAIEH